MKVLVFFFVVFSLSLPACFCEEAFSRFCFVSRPFWLRLLVCQRLRTHAQAPPISPTPPTLSPPKGARKNASEREKKNARWESAPSKFPKNTLSLFFLLSPTVSRWLFEGSPSQTPRFPLTLRQNSHSKWVQHAETHTDTHHTRVRTSRQVWDTENAINERRNGAPLRGVLGSSASARMRNHNAPQHTPVR